MVGDSELFLLQSRIAKRDAPEAVRIAVELVKEGLIEEERGDPAHRSGLAGAASASDHRARRRPRPHRQGHAGLAGRGDAARSSSPPSARRNSPAEGRAGHPGAQRDASRGHPRHARRRGRADRARRHDEPCRRRRARHRQALRHRRRLAAHRCSSAANCSAPGVTLQGRRAHHHRRLERRGDPRARSKLVRPMLVRRFRDADGVRRPGAAHGRAHQCRDADRGARGALLRRRGHRPLPHRAHVLRGRPHPARCAR